jgi:integrase
MVVTGQYHADIKKRTLTISKTKMNVNHCSYRRAKNDSKCKGIPIKDHGVFIGEKLINHYNINDGENFPYPLTLNTLDKHLKEISFLAGLDISITTKMGRKSFASRLYYDHNLDIKHIQVLLGHKSIKDTYKYLRIEDDDIANAISKELSRN